jgi:drug/metabolite transporter (DMT)-like permease
MTAFALLLVTMGAVLHAYWNLLAKQSYNKTIFLWWSGVAGSLIFLPAVLWSTPTWSWGAKTWAGIALAVALRAGYFALLGAAYARGDLSLVYPLARATSLVLVPILAILLLKEDLSTLGGLGVGIVVLGIYVLHLPSLDQFRVLVPFRHLRSSHTSYATLTGLIIAAYSVVDKWNLSGEMLPLVYTYLTIPIPALLLTPISMRRMTAAMAEWNMNRRLILAASLLIAPSFLLLFLALQFTAVSYVVAAKQLGILFSTVLGSIIQKEGFLPQRLIGASLIVVGVLLLSAAH